MTERPTILVVAKAPVSGLAKTRLAAAIGYDAAARIAAASLLDTLHAVEELGWPVTVAMTGDLASAERREELTAALEKHRVIPQRGEGFADRLIAAHHDAAAGHGVIQIGMDTPQVTAENLQAAGDILADGDDAALGLAEDGGWWVLAVREPRWSESLAEVPMSTAHTGERTREALLAAGASLGQVPELADVDTWADARAVAALIPHSRFAAEVTRISTLSAAAGSGPQRTDEHEQAPEHMGTHR